MKRSVWVLILLVASGTFAIAAPTPHPTLTFVKASHHHDKRVQRHHAHKAGKHHTPKRPHHRAV